MTPPLTPLPLVTSWDVICHHRLHVGIAQRIQTQQSALCRGLNYYHLYYLLPPLPPLPSSSPLPLVTNSNVICHHFFCPSPPSLPLSSPPLVIFTCCMSVLRIHNQHCRGLNNYHYYQLPPPLSPSPSPLQLVTFSNIICHHRLYVSVARIQTRQSALCRRFNSIPSAPRHHH